MIRKLTLQDHEKVLKFLTEEKAINLFIIGDIENFGYAEDFQDLWAEFDSENNINAVLLRYYDSFIPYAKGDFNVEGFTELIKGFGKKVVLSGKAGVTEPFETIPELSLGKKRSMYFAEVTEDQLINKAVDDRIKKATIDDVDRLIALHTQIDEFSPTEESRSMLVRTFESGSGRTMYMEEQGEMIAAVSTTAENSYSAMIVGVCTQPNYRQKGYASVCLSALCKEVIGEGKTLCLFYDNSAAGKIYKRLGFKEIGKWNMYKY